MIAPIFQALRLRLWEYTGGGSRAAPWEAPPASVAKAPCGAGDTCDWYGIALRLACNVIADDVASGSYDELNIVIFVGWCSMTRSSVPIT